MRRTVRGGLHRLRAQPAWGLVQRLLGLRGGCAAARGMSTLSDISSIELPLPALSPTMETGVINSWKKKVGDFVEAGDVIADIQTDKAVVDFECQDEGYLAAILVDEGGEHPVGTLVAIMVENEEDIAKAQEIAKGLSTGPAGATPIEPVAEAAAAAGTTSSAPEPQASAAGSYEVKTLLPSAAVLIHRNHIDPSSIAPTGPKGHILKGDVLAAIASGSFRTLESTESSPAMAATAAPAPTTESKEGKTTASSDGSPDPSKRGRTYTDIPLSNMRKVIAKRLTQSKQDVPHAYSSVRCSLDAILALRKSMKEQDQKPPSLNDFVIKASALALRDVPEANCTWDEKAQLAVYHDAVDISVAVATPDGLITPIIKNAHHLRLAEISGTMKDLAVRAKEKKLLPEEFQGGTFTISNLGMFGINHFSAVINPPQTCIMAVGGGVDVMIDKDPSNFEASSPEDMVKSTTMTVTVSSDERCVDQATTSLMLTAFRGYMENPLSML